MEVSQQLRCFSSLPSTPAVERTTVTASFSGRVFLEPKTTTTTGRLVNAMQTEFRDLGHLHYYDAARTSRFCISAKKKKEKMKMKQSKDSKEKNLKLLKDLSQNLSLFADTGFGVDFSQLQADRVSEAADVILKQLEKLKAEEKQEKDKLKAEQMAAMNDNDSSSSSSSSESSESSDSECSEAIDMIRLGSQPEQRYNDSQSAAAQVAAVLSAPLPSLPTTNATEERGFEDVTSLLLHKHEKESDCRRTTSSCCSTSSRRVEVCMGNKCKKLGSAALLEEFARQMGGEGAVVGCKCMGKCRSAPNVKVMNTASVEGATDDVSVRTAHNNALCIGVGLEDVTAIVASLLGEDGTKGFGLAAAV